MSDLHELSAREEGWIPTGECRIEDMDDLELDVVESMVRHREPAFFNVELGEPASADSWQTLCEQQGITVYDDTFRIPDDLSDEAKVLARKLRQFVKDWHGDDNGVYRAGGTFRAPAFQERFEQVRAPATAVMAVVFDGGPLAPLMNLSYQNYKGFDAITKWLDEQGYWFENYTHWWAWVLEKE